LVSGDFRRIAVVGCGLIGGSILLALRERQPQAEVITLDRGDDLARVRGADLVVLAVPIRVIIAILPDLRPHLTPDTLVTDTGSTKAAVVDAAAGLRFIGGHPIAGAAASGPTAARPDLFDGRPWILTPTSAVDEPDVARLRRLLESLGAHIHVLGADEHDRLLAVVSHLPQLTISAPSSTHHQRADVRCRRVRRRRRAGDRRNWASRLDQAREQPGRHLVRHRCDQPLKRHRGDRRTDRGAVAVAG
jgi:prephenate dehydrogenase